MRTKFYPIALAIVVLIFSLPFIFKPELLTIRDNDLGRTYIPLFEFFKDSIYTKHQFPTWRPSQMMGETLIGNPLWAPIYPVNLIFLLLPVGLGAVIYLVLHLQLAAASTYFLARSFRLPALSAFAAALFYVFSTKILLHISAGHITMISAASFIPLAFLSTRSLINKPSFAWIAAGAISLTAMYISYPTIFYYTIIFLTIYSIYKYPYTRIRKMGLQKLVRYLLPFVALAFITFGLAAAALLPQIEFAPFSTRNSMSFEDVAQPTWNLKRFATSLLLPYIKFSSFDHEAFLYLGAVPTLLAILGFWHLPKTRKIVFGVFGLLATAFASGASTPVFKVAYEFLPSLKYSRVPTRLWFQIALVAALLAALGVSKIKSKTITLIIITIFLAENLFIGYTKIFSVPSLSFSNENLYQYLAGDTQPFRVYCTTYCFNPQLLTKYKINILAGETPIQDKKVVEFLQAAGNYKYDRLTVIFPPYQVWQVSDPPQPNPQLLAQADVKYVASTYELNNESFRLIDKFENIYLYQNTLMKVPTLLSLGYQPKSFPIGAAISIFTILSLFLWYIFQNKAK
ncbi:MAG: hypothetical protein WD988_00305 [Candidatus Curtissbacteria bacterium]